MKKKPGCATCSYLMTAKLEGEIGVSWLVCKHREFSEMFPQGRALDLEDLPDWCPLTVPVKAYEPEKLSTVQIRERINPLDLDIATIKDGNGVSCVRILHKPTGLTAESNEFKSVHKNRDTALQRLHTLIVMQEHKCQLSDEGDDDERDEC